MENMSWQMERMHQLMEFGERVAKYEGEELVLVDVDDGFCNMLGYSRGELMTLSRGKVSELIYKPDFVDAYVEIRQSIMEEGHYSCRYRMRRKDGFLFWVWESAECELDEQGNTVIRSLVVDVTKEEDTKRKRDTTYDNIPGGVMTLLVTEENFYVTDANNRYFSMLGAESDIYLGTSGIYTMSQDLPGLRNHIVERAKERRPIEYEFRTRYAGSQEIRWYRVLGKYYEDVNDGCEYLCILLDVTEQKLNLIQLEKEKERYQIAMGIQANNLFEYDMQKRHFHMYGDFRNENFRICMDEDIDEVWYKLVGDHDYIHPEDKSKIIEFARGGNSASLQVRLLTEDRKTGEKTYQWYEFHAIKQLHRGKVKRVIGSAKNIESEKNSEDASKAVREILEIQANKTYEMIIKIDLKAGRVEGYFTNGSVFSNEYTKTGFNHYMEKIAEEYVHPDDREQFLSVFLLENMTEILKYSVPDEAIYFRMRYPKDEYRYKCYQFSYLGNETDVIIVSIQDLHEFRVRQLQSEAADRKIMENALSEAKNTLEMRRNFLAILSREILEPVQFICGSLKGARISDKTRDEMLSASRYVLEVIQNMSEYERINQGKVRVENRRISLSDTLESIMDVWKTRVHKMGLRLEYNFNMGWDEHYGDAVRFRQILDNIIGNCLMTSYENGTIKIWGNVEDQGSGISCLSLVFEDQGIPFEEEYFGRAYPTQMANDKIDWKKPDSISYATFSLVLARRLAELLGGHLYLSSPGEDTNVIRLELAFQQEETDSDTELESEETSAGEAMLNGYRILVVECGDVDGDLVGARLKLNGAKADVAYTGREGLELCQSYQKDGLDAILVEGYLPDMDYVAFVRELHKLKGVGETPVFVMVDDVRHEGVHFSIEEGINAYLKKPLELKRLQQMLEIYYDRSRSEKR